MTLGIFWKIDLGAYESRPGNGGAPGWYDLSWFRVISIMEPIGSSIRIWANGFFVNQWTPKDLYFYLDELGWIWTSPSI